MAFPATYGQGVTNPDTCLGATPVAETGVTDPANDDPSSFAAGCGAHAGTDGSVAIGDKAEVKKYQVSSPPIDIPGAVQGTLKIGSAAPLNVIIDRNGGVLKVYEADEDWNVANSVPIKVPEATPGVSVTLTETATPGGNIPGTKMDMGGGAIAIGDKAHVLGEESIAIGAKTEVREIKEGPVGFKGTLKIGSAAPLNVIIKRSNGTLKVYEADENWNRVVGKSPIKVPEATPGVSVTLTETAERSPDSFLPVTRAVAVGADVKVTGDNAVAIGAGASAKANSIAIGADVEAGENEIVIGNGNATKVEVGGMDLMGIDKNVAGNRTNIDANTGNITTNAGNITTNSAHISTNVGNIATNTDNIVTNSSNINVNARDILNNKAGIAMAIALAHIPAATGGSRGSVGIGGGFFDGKEAIAIGASFRVGDRGQAKLGISHSSGETGGGVGVGFNF